MGSGKLKNALTIFKHMNTFLRLIVQLFKPRRPELPEELNEEEKDQAIREYLQRKYGDHSAEWGGEIKEVIVVEREGSDEPDKH